MRFLFLHIIILVFVFAACNNSNQAVTIEPSNKGLVLINGVLELNKVPFSGRLVSFFSKEKLESEMYYIDGKKDGYEKQWFENGDLAIERFYKNGFKTGTHKGWWENGKPKFQYYFNDRGEFHGRVKEWYQTGFMFRDFNYINGKEIGSQKLWYETGKIKANYEVVNGERFGLIGLKKCYTVTVGSDDVK